MFDLTDMGVNALLFGSTNGEVYIVNTNAVFSEPDYTKHNINEMI